MPILRQSNDPHDPQQINKEGEEFPLLPPPLIDYPGNRQTGLVLTQGGEEFYRRVPLAALDDYGVLRYQFIKNLEPNNEREVDVKFTVDNQSIV